MNVDRVWTKEEILAELSVMTRPVTWLATGLRGDVMTLDFGTWMWLTVGWPLLIIVMIVVWRAEP